ncbi:MAG: hypothetical protein HONDAALG_01728 [Gammaproteobacteria bacterium]|nr:hypothetical protein [Gammaproteobacteria bacterium]
MLYSALRTPSVMKSRYPILVLLVAACAALPAQARMYQWVNPQTGRTHMSGKPPAWYRSDKPGPRVFVFENGRLIDDTARAVAIEERAALRATAFAETPAASGPQTAAPGGEPATPETTEAKPGTSVLERGFGESESAASTAPAEPPDATIARLKSIIDAWEQQQTTEARRLLEQKSVVAPISPPAAGTAATEEGTAPAPVTTPR